MFTHFDPFFQIVDDEIVDNEEREALIGMTIGWHLLYVVYTVRGDTIRIISARKATRSETRDYYAYLEEAFGGD